MFAFYEKGRITQQTIMTPLSDLGQFALIEHLTDSFPLRNQSSVKGIGDDGAVVGTEETKTIINTHILAEGIHFDITYTNLKHLGYKTVAIGLSGIAAMNGKPEQVMIGLAVSSRYSVEALEELYAGIRLCCERYKVDLVGGDMTSSRSGLVITITAIGTGEQGHITYRSGAKEHNLICVSGDLGSAYSGLLVLQREKATFDADPNFRPDLHGYEHVLERWLKPEPRIDIVQLLAREGIVPTSMIDVSDGLASEMLHICQQSQCGCEVYEERIPIDYQTTRVCSELSPNMLPVSNALNGGSDYELLFTIDLKDYEKVKELSDIHIIGHITEKGMPAVMVTPQNSTIELHAQGWESSSK